MTKISENGKLVQNIRILFNIHQIIIIWAENSLTFSSSRLVASVKLRYIHSLSQCIMMSFSGLCALWYFREVYLWFARNPSISKRMKLNTRACKPAAEGLILDFFGRFSRADQRRRSASIKSQRFQGAFAVFFQSQRGGWRFMLNLTRNHVVARVSMTRDQAEFKLKVPSPLVQSICVNLRRESRKFSEKI